MTGEEVDDELHSEGENGDEDDEDDVHDIDHTNLTKETVRPHNPTSRTRKGMTVKFGYLKFEYDDCDYPARLEYRVLFRT